MSFESKEYGLVLAGGGTKGAYQVGVWQALQELNIKIKAIVGASIGALNGALMLQDNLENMLEVYENIEITNIMKITDEIDTSKDLFDIVNLKKFLYTYITNKGIENTPLRELITKYIDIDKIYNSEIDFGLITYSLKNKEPLQLFKNDIKKDEMVEYLLASSCFPIFKSQKIGDIEYMDGGLYDNSPINMLIEKGYKNIIIANIDGIGFYKKTKDKNIYLKVISPNQSLGGTFEFNHEKIRNNIKLGYLDTMKSFNKMQGHIYYFKSEEFNKMLEIFNLQTIYGLECAAKIYGLEKEREYTFEEFVKLLYKKDKKAQDDYQKVKKNWKELKVKSIKEYVETIIDGELSICLAKDLYLEKPISKKFSSLKRILKNHFESAKALIELENYLN